MSVPEAVTNEIKALKQAHAELAAKVDALAATSVKLLTAEGERFLDMSLKVDVLSDRVRALESPASGVLGVVVDGGDLQPFVGGFTEPPAPAPGSFCGTNEYQEWIDEQNPAPDPVCASCGHGSEDHTFGQGECMEPICGCAGFVPTAEPEPAPLDPVCFECGWPKSIHEDGDEFIPSPELDPVRLEAAARALLLSFNPSNRWDSDEQRDWHDTYLDQAASVIRAYGRDGAR